MLWATRRGCHVDRTACVWLIKRFVDPGATFAFFGDPVETFTEVVDVWHAGPLRPVNLLLADWGDAGGYEFETTVWDTVTTQALGMPFERAQWRACA